MIGRPGAPNPNKSVSQITIRAALKSADSDDILRDDRDSHSGTNWEEQMPGPQTALGYIATQLKDPTDLGKFTKEWSALNDTDKITLKKWAVEEMDALGISHT